MISYLQNQEITYVPALHMQETRPAEMNGYHDHPTEPASAPFPANALAPTIESQRDAPWKSALQPYRAISLPEMSGVALLRRTDVKYLLSEEQLLCALAGLTGAYRILEIDGRRLHGYRTVYFDTPDLALYRQHHNGWRERYKVRKRAYTDYDLAFLEIKHKIDATTTVKSRVQTRTLSPRIARDAAPFVRTHSPYQMDELRPTLLNAFRRITLVSTQDVERLTLDLDLGLSWNGTRLSLPGLAIAEVKRERYSIDSPFIQQMRALGVRATGFSKYCIGISMLYPGVKHNRFKPQLRQIAELSVHRRASCPAYSCC
jgi:hypothetical protein